MDRRRNSRGGLAVVVGLALAALAVTGCGQEEPADLVNGKSLFIGEAACGSCHVLERAGTTGTQGPDLDAAFGPSRRVGMDEETVEGIVRRQIAHPGRSSSMPADLATGDDADDIAAYVAAVAGVPGEDEGELAEVGQQEEAKPVEVTGGSLEIPADPNGQLAFVTGSEENPGRVTRIIASPGPLELIMPNPSPIQHNVAVSNGIEEIGEVVGTGGTSRVTVDLKPGEYTFLCTVPGHAEGGMAGDLIVE